MNYFFSRDAQFIPLSRWLPVVCLFVCLSGPIEGGIDSGLTGNQLIPSSQQIVSIVIVVNSYTALCVGPVVHSCCPYCPAPECALELYLPMTAILEGCRLRDESWVPSVPMFVPLINGSSVKRNTLRPPTREDLSSRDLKAAA